MVAVLGLFLFAVWFLFMFTFFWFYWFLAPAAVRRWAAEEGYRIVRMRQAGLLTWLAVRSSLESRAGQAQRLYRVDVQDKAGRSQEVVLLVGDRDIPILLSSRCPVEVVGWREEAPHADSARSHAPAKLALWDRDLDG
jgi:hypothetical protein